MVGDLSQVAQIDWAANQRLRQGQASQNASSVDDQTAPVVPGTVDCGIRTILVGNTAESLEGWCGAQFLRRHANVAVDVVLRFDPDGWARMAGGGAGGAVEGELARSCFSY